MLAKLFFISLCLFGGAKANILLTFKNVMLTCETDNDVEELAFVTSITANRLKPHLPSGQDCSKIAIEHSMIPILYDGSLADITRVNILLLEDNKIEQIQPGAFRNLKVQEGMSLKFNRLTEIRSGVFNDIQVPFLYLSYNYISRIDRDAFDNMTSLRSLYLDNNKLAYIDSNWFKNTPQLRKLVLQQNTIDYIPAFAFNNLAMSRYHSPEVDLSNNLIRLINRDAFKRERQWSRFNFVSLAHNEVQDLSLDWLKNVEIKTLDLSYNRIMCLNRGGLAGANSVNYVDGNPWICTCLQEVKQKEFKKYGQVVAEEAFKRCQI
ncbi:LRR 8 domain containing protein [Asbolus verrucosus]|uniref:LRR 8 domain containing protein n=1 Tax=Asbolus verrucosus TaxID=1661398 RepID=A0A482WE28_ASBVE|nr:LRR 8 domain containing protein [Asbolus verrucosus]